MSWPRHVLPLPKPPFTSSLIVYSGFVHDNQCNDIPFPKNRFFSKSSHQSLTLYFSSWLDQG